MLLMIAPLTRAAVDVGVDHAREVADLDAGLDAVFVEQPLERLGVERDPAVVMRDPVFRRHLGPEIAALVHGLDQLAGEAADQRALAVAHRAEGVDQPRGRHAAERAGRLDQQHLGAEARGADRGGAAGRTAARDQDVVALLDRNATGEIVGLHAAGPLIGARETNDPQSRCKSLGPHGVAAGGA